jgi:DNA-nicking Smr family endonuclease
MLRIITGKGLHSPGAPVLPDVVEQKLHELKEKKLIKSFEWEKKRKSASGALLVFL